MQNAAALVGRVAAVAGDTAQISFCHTCCLDCCVCVPGEHVLAFSNDSRCQINHVFVLWHAVLPATAGAHLS